ncbi:MAG: pyridoxamine 5'-phosphate oxidase family protein [Polyangiales bacterium]|nr:pyridoxamine 5'-phosphate oxidase family protein [Myxococcales bacterium]MCB9660165.1 pyridoxamine 5'-phosphate oxidase family protein [Sandaracinaceae bacterium]
MDKVDIAAFLELGLGVFVGTRDAQRVPHGVSGSAVKLLSEGRAVVYVPEHECAQAVANVLDNGAIAVLFDQPTTHRGYQLKGRVTAVRAETAEEAEEVRAFVGRLMAEYAVIGVAPEVIERLVFSPCRAIEFAYDEVYEQTPGPGAGKAVQSTGDA